MIETAENGGKREGGGVSVEQYFSPSILPEAELPLLDSGCEKRQQSQLITHLTHKLHHLHSIGTREQFHRKLPSSFLQPHFHVISKHFEFASSQKWEMRFKKGRVNQKAFEKRKV